VELLYHSYEVFNLGSNFSRQHIDVMNSIFSEIYISITDKKSPSHPPYAWFVMRLPMDVSKDYVDYVDYVSLVIIP
jgi:hypothetical protein